LFIDNLKTSLINKSHLVASLASEKIKDPASYSTLDAEVKSLSKEINARITIILLDGTVIAESDYDPAKMENHCSVLKFKWR